MKKKLKSYQQFSVSCYYIIIIIQYIQGRNIINTYKTNEEKELSKV